MLAASEPPRAGESTLSVRVLRGLLAAAERFGVPRAKFLRSAGLRPEALEVVDGRVSLTEVLRVCELVMDMSGDPALGLQLGRRMNGSALDPVANLVAHAASLREALAALVQFHPLLSDRASFELLEDAERVTLRCALLGDRTERAARFCIEALVAGLFSTVREFNPQGRVECVSFEYAPPGHRAAYAAVFGGLERFGQPFTGLVFDRALMDAPSPHEDSDVHRALRVVAERQLLRASRSSIALRVREIVEQHAGGHRPDMATVARRLDLSERSLRRRLAAEGTSYGAITNDALALVAQRLLVDERRSIQETAFEMGYSDARGFHRAFRSWTGTTPRAFRDAVLGSSRSDSSRSDSTEG